MPKAFRITIPLPFVLEVQAQPPPGESGPPKMIKIPCDFPRYAATLMSGDPSNNGFPNSDIQARLKAKLEKLSKSSRVLVVDEDEKARLESGLRATKFAVNDVAVAYSEHGYTSAILAAEECEIDGEGKLIPAKKK